MAKRKKIEIDLVAIDKEIRNEIELEKEMIAPYKKRFNRQSYSEKLKDPRWQRKRLEVMNRDDFTCQLCQTKEKTLHVHHEQYKGDPWDVDIDKLRTLCEDCHAAVENVKGFKIRHILRHALHPEIILLFGIYDIDDSRAFLFWNIYTKEIVVGLNEETILELLKDAS